MRVLAVRPHWAYPILKKGFNNLALKNIEVRSMNTQPGKIAIYSTTHQYTGAESQHIDEWMAYLNKESYISDDEIIKAAQYSCWKDKGHIIGTVEIDRTKKVDSFDEYKKNTGRHLAPDEYFKLDNTWFWYLKNPVRFEKPIPYKPPKGAVVWSNFDMTEA